MAPHELMGGLKQSFAGWQSSLDLGVPNRTMDPMYCRRPEYLAQHEVRIVARSRRIER